MKATTDRSAALLLEDPDPATLGRHALHNFNERVGKPPPEMIYRLPSDRSFMHSVGGACPLADICRWLASLYEPAGIN